MWVQQIFRTGFFLTLLTFILTGAKPRIYSGKEPIRNVLFIFVDDLRPDLGCYGNSFVQSPNIDALAAKAVIFNRHYVVVPTCGASRAALLTGYRPRTKSDLSNEIMEREVSRVTTDKGSSGTFIGHFRRNGYKTIGIGKVSHSADGYVYKYLEPRSDKQELPGNWDEVLMDAGKWGTGCNAFFGYADGSNRNMLKGEVKPYEAADVSDEGYPDGLTAKLAVNKLAELAANGKPFFLGVGFYKPHLPFNAPQKYWDLYDESSLPIAAMPDLPVNVHRESLQESGEFGSYKNGEEKASLDWRVSDAYSRKLRHGYYACVSYMDAQVGKLLDKLKETGLDKNTIVVLWGDHGWHLGDDRVWGKHTLSEWSLRSPLIVKLPGSQKGSISDHIISSVDIYPTIMDLCGIKSPENIDGKSHAEMIKRNARSKKDQVAYSYYNNGITCRTDRYRLTRYYRKSEPVLELYDYLKDPNETKNIANDNPEVVQKLLPLLEKGNTGIYTTVGGKD